MSEITLQAIQAKQTELAQMIAKLATQAHEPSVVTVEEIDIELQPGEHYAGAVLNEDGTVKHHLVLLADKPSDTLTWEAAKAWAATVDGSLPDRREAALIYANCKPHVDARWHWTSEAYESNASYAWLCLFNHGHQSHSNVSSAGAARAVRRLKP
jgi:hypothetical protein